MSLTAVKAAAARSVKTEMSQIFRVTSKLIFVCLLVVIRSSGTFTTADKPNSLLSYRNKAQFQKAILIAQSFERTGIKASESPGSKANHAVKATPQFYVSCSLAVENFPRQSFSFRTHQAPRGPPRES